MQLTKDQIESFKAASLPLMRWMRENCHPHVACIVNSEGSELLEGLASAVRSLAEAEIAISANNRDEARR